MTLTAPNDPFFFQQPRGKSQVDNNQGDSPCLTISPGTKCTINARSSRCWIANCPPPKAVSRSTSTSTDKLLSCRLNFSWGFSSRTITTSPGVTSGAWSLSPAKVIVWPPFMPLSMCTSKNLRSETSFLPLQVLHLSLALMISPVPSHSEHACWICWSMGPICRRVTLMPRPLHPPHGLTAPAFPPLPLHFEQMTCLVSASLVVLPL